MQCRVIAKFTAILVMFTLYVAVRVCKPIYSDDFRFKSAYFENTYCVKWLSVNF